jgi:hypothetical protein
VVRRKARFGASESTPAEEAEGRRYLNRAAGKEAPRDGSLRGFFAFMPGAHGPECNLASQGEQRDTQEHCDKQRMRGGRRHRRCVAFGPFAASAKLSPHFVGKTVDNLLTCGVTT